MALSWTVNTSVWTSAILLIRLYNPTPCGKHLRETAAELYKYFQRQWQGSLPLSPWEELLADKELRALIKCWSGSAYMFGGYFFFYQHSQHPLLRSIYSHPCPLELSRGKKGEERREQGKKLPFYMKIPYLASSLENAYHFQFLSHCIFKEKNKGVLPLLSRE